MLSAGHPDHPARFMVVEVGYTSESKYAEELQEKMTQHGKLQRALSRIDFEVSSLPVTFGTPKGFFIRSLDSLKSYMHTA